MTGLTVVIPTRGPTPQLTAMLRSLNEALPIDARVEVFLVDDGSSGDFQPCREGLSMPVEVIHVAERRGPAHARNLGANHGSMAVNVFLDDDVVIPVTWFHDIQRAVDDPAVAGWDLLGGDIRSVQDRNLIAQMFEALVIRHGRLGERWFLSTANVLVRREAFALLGGFDERFKDAAGEDWDLCRRAHSIGLTVEVSEAFHVLHWNPTRFRALSSRARRYASSSPLRFASWRPKLAGDETALLRLARQVRSPLRVLLAPITVLIPNFVRRYRDIRRRGHGRLRSMVLLALHVPWFLTYAFVSYRTLRRHEAAGTLDELGPRFTAVEPVEVHNH